MPEPIAKNTRVRGTKDRKRPYPRRQDQQAQSTFYSSRKVFLGVVFGIALLYYQGLIFTFFETWWAGREDHQTGAIKILADTDKQAAIVRAFKFAWLAYERDAMGDDEYHPIARRGSNLSSAGGIGYTVIDTIDTMQIMGLDEEYQRARDWVANVLSFERDGNYNVFETTIRVLGGLLSAYHLSSEDPIFLERAVELADRMLPAFDTPSGLPLSMINLGKRHGIDNEKFSGLISTAEAATLQLEFRYLSFLTDDEIYWEKAGQVMKVIEAAGARLPSSLVPIYMSAEHGQFLVSDIRLGSRGDSYYEYLLKQYLQTNRTELIYKKMYDDAMTSIHSSLIQKGINRGALYTAELVPIQKPNEKVEWRLVPKQDHFVCFLGGSLMLGATTAGSMRQKVSKPPLLDDLWEIGRRDWDTGSELIETCIDMHDTPTGLPPEIAYFYTKESWNDSYIDDKDWYIKDNEIPGRPASYDARYILRPETVESLFIAYRLTGDDKYREYGWRIFLSIERFCRVETGGYASILNVENPKSRVEDRMETFLMSETFKYLYLLFADESILPLDEFVFNTEAHPLPIFVPTMLGHYV